MWKESYRLGVERIDKQHQKLFKMTGALVQAARDGAGEETYKKQSAIAGWKSISSSTANLPERYRNTRKS